MELEELDEIIRLMNVDSICRRMEEQGYRLANPEGVWEFNLLLIGKDCKSRKQVDWEDRFNHFIYHADMYEKVTGFDGIVFIDILVHRLQKIRKQQVPIPYKRFFYTNAPVNEEYERFQSEVVKCARCKRLYARKNLIDWVGEELCGGCLAYVMDLEE